MPARTASSSGTDRGRPGAAAGGVDLDAEDVRPGGRPLSPLRPNHQHHPLALAVAAAVAASVTTGLVVQHRAAAVAEQLAEAAGALPVPPRVEVGYPEVSALPADADGPRARVVLPVLNAGGAPLVVTSVDLTARAGLARMEEPGIEVAPGERVRVALEASPRCAVVASGSNDVASLAVREPGGATSTVSTELASPFGRPALEEQLQQLCAGDGVRAVVSLLPDHRSVSMRLTNTSDVPVELNLRAPRASRLASDPPLPLELATGGEVSVILSAAPVCDTWSGGLPAVPVDVVWAPRPTPRGAPGEQVPSGWSALLTSWVGGQVARACDDA